MSDHAGASVDTGAGPAQPAYDNGDNIAYTRIDAVKTATIVKALKARSRGLKMNAWAALIMILVLLLGGGLMLYNIDEILGKQNVQLDITDAVSQLAKIKASVEEVGKQTISKDSKIAQTNAILQRLADEPVIGIEESFAKVRESRDRIAKYEADLKSLRFRREPSEQTLSQNLDLLAAIERRLLGSKDGLNDQEQLDRLSSELEDVESYINRREFQLREARNEVDRNDLSTNDRRDWDKQINELTRDLEDARRHQTSVRQEIDRTNQRLLANREEQTLAQNRVNEARTKLAIIDADIAEIQTLLEAEKANSTEFTTSLSTTRDQVDAMMQRITGIRSSVETLTADNAKATRLIENTEVTLTGQIADWDRELGALKTSADTGGETKIWSSLGTRAALIVILLFLVQILVTLYRYNMRLASFYDARIDALELAGSSTIKELGDLIMHLSPEQLDFGKTPATVTEQAFDLAKTLLNRDARKPGTP